MKWARGGLMWAESGRWWHVLHNSAKLKGASEPFFDFPIRLSGLPSIKNGEHDETNLICFGYAGPVGRRSPCPDEHNDRHDNNDDDYDDQTNHYR